MSKRESLCVTIKLLLYSRWVEMSVHILHWTTLRPYQRTHSGTKLDPLTYGINSIEIQLRNCNLLGYYAASTCCVMTQKSAVLSYNAAEA